MEGKVEMKLRSYHFRIQLEEFFCALQLACPLSYSLWPLLSDQTVGRKEK